MQTHINGTMNGYSDKPFSVRALASRIAAQRKRWAAATRKATERAVCEDLFALAPIPIVVLRGYDLILEHANEAALNLIGAGDAVGRPLLELLPEMSGQGCARVLRDVLATGAPHICEEAFIGLDERRPPFQGKRYWTFTCTRWLREDGRDPNVVVVLADVTAQVVARRRTEELVAAAEAASRAKDQFFAMLSHELRNPLSPIVTALELMRLRGLDTPEQALIERQVRHLVRLVDDLLDVSRIACGQITLERRPMELAAVVAAAVETVSPLLDERHHRLTVDLPNGLVVDVDPDRTGQVVANLLTNAAKYSPEGSRIWVRAEAAGGRVRLSVKDEGIGIEPECLDSVFDAFARHAEGRGRSEGGLGLGLTIVANLVRLHGGEVRAHSEGPGTGSEFVVVLPAAERKASAAPAGESKPVAEAPRTHRVLVVDDNRDAAETLASALESVGYGVRIAHDGPSALSVARSFTPDAAFVDLGLPVMDGYELAARLKAQGGVMRLIAVTGYGQAEDRRRSQAAGFERHLVKPVALHDVLAVLEDKGAGAG